MSRQAINVRSNQHEAISLILTVNQVTLCKGKGSLLVELIERTAGKEGLKEEHEMCLLTSLSGQVQVPGARLYFHLVHFQLGSILSGHRFHNQQLSAIYTDAAILHHITQCYNKAATLTHCTNRTTDAGAMS